jgi:hypothetical protein
MFLVLFFGENSDSTEYAGEAYKSYEYRTIYQLVG